MEFEVLAAVDGTPLPTAPCRCCLLDSSCAKLCKDYFWNGKRVVYTDLLMDTFGLNLVSSSDLNQAICEDCITRLIDATEFKKQVQECEATLNTHPEASTNKLKNDSGLKLEWIIKEETIDIYSTDDNTKTIHDDNNYDSDLKLGCVIKEETIDIDTTDDNTKTIDDDDNNCDPFLSEILTKPAATGPTAKEERVTKTVKKRPTLNKKSNSMVSTKIMIPSNKSKDIAYMSTSSSLKTLKIGKNMVKKKIFIPASKLKDIADVPESCGLKSLKIGNKTVYLKVRSNKPSSTKQVTSKHFNNIVRSNTSNLSDGSQELLETNIQLKNDLTVKKVFINKSVKGAQQIISQNKISTTNPVQSKAVPDVTKIKENAKQMLLHTTAYPFRFPTPHINVACVYCMEEDIEPANYRAHIDTNHPNTVDPRKAYNHIRSSDMQLKVECSYLRCRICNKSFNTLETIAKHLNEDHKKKIDLTVDFGLAPFKFSKNKVFTCAVCGKEFVRLMTLSKHTTKHYSRFMCDKCGKGYSSSSILRYHQKFGHVDKPICTRCTSTFESRDELTKHIENSVKCQPYVCYDCNERFAKLYQRKHHMIAVHGKNPYVYKCFICQQEFTEKKVYSLHIARNHAAEIGIKCDICDKKFLYQYEVTQHMSIHTGATPYQCEKCEKAYATKKTLTQHVRINHKHHYSCDECKKHFGCKSSLLNHNAKYH